MDRTTVLSPLGVNQVKAQPIAARLASLEGIRLGVLNNAKPNSLELQHRVAELIEGRHRITRVVTKQKPSAAVGASSIDLFATEVDAVVTAIGD